MATVHDWVLVAALTLPHLLYAAVWLHPGAWRSLFRGRPVRAFQTAALIGKGMLASHSRLRGTLHTLLTELSFRV